MNCKSWFPRKELPNSECVCVCVCGHLLLWRSAFLQTKKMRRYFRRKGRDSNITGYLFQRTECSFYTRGKIPCDLKSSNCRKRHPTSSDIKRFSRRRRRMFCEKHHHAIISQMSEMKKTHSLGPSLPWWKLHTRKSMSKTERRPFAHLDNQGTFGKKNSKQFLVTADSRVRLFKRGLSYCERKKKRTRIRRLRSKHRSISSSLHAYQILQQKSNPEVQISQTL